MLIVVGKAGLTFENYICSSKFNCVSTTLFEKRTYNVISEKAEFISHPVTFY